MRTNEVMVIRPSDDASKIKNASNRIKCAWWYKLPNMPEMPIQKNGRYWHYKIPTINGLETQLEDVFYNALYDLHISNATIYNK